MVKLVASKSSPCTAAADIAPSVQVSDGQRFYLKGSVRWSEVTFLSLRSKLCCSVRKRTTHGVTGTLESAGVAPAVNDKSKHDGSVGRRTISLVSTAG